MDTLVISHTSALRALRLARRAYSDIPWRPLTPAEQRRALQNCKPNPSSVDFDLLARYGFWEPHEDNRLDILTSNSANRRTSSPVACHLLSRELPPGSLLEIEKGLYCTSPAFTAYLYARNRSVPEIAVLLMELLGTYTLPPDSTVPIIQGSAWPPNSSQGANPLLDVENARLDSRGGHPDCISRRPGLDCTFEHRDPNFAEKGLDPEINDISDVAFHDVDQSASQSTLPIADAPIEQAHYGCEAVVTMKQLHAIARWSKSNRYRQFAQALSLVAPNSASPAETIQYCMLGFPMRYGGFACASLPKGMLLNHRIDFTHDAVLMSSGMPYAIADVFIPAANTDIEHNGIGHEELPARIHDGNRNNGLRGMGINVIVIQRDQMRDIAALEAIARTIYRFAGVRFRYQGKGHRIKQESLLNILRRATGLPPA